MFDYFKEAFSMVLTIGLGMAVVVITILAADYFATQQRHAFIVKCMADLGSNNIELCASIAK